MNPILCVAHFSEGQNRKTIETIAHLFKNSDGVELLGVESRIADNRTVYTLSGTPDKVAEAAFQSIAYAKTQIDMRTHKGEHPRQGACDAVTFVAASEGDSETATEAARRLGTRVGGELNVPVYCFGEAAFSPERKSLDNCIKGEYEGLRTKIYSEAWKPDFGFNDFSEEVARSGATCIGVQEPFVEINFNLNTSSETLARRLAETISTEGFSATKINNTEHKIAQIRVKIASSTPLSVVWETVCEKAATQGLRLTGSDLVGLVPLKTMTDAGRYFLNRQNRSWGVSAEEQIRIAVLSMGLSSLRPFVAEEKIIEYRTTSKHPAPVFTETIDTFLLSDKIEAEGVVPLLVAAMASRLIARRVHHYGETEESVREKYSMLADKCHQKAAALTLATERFNDIVSQIKAAHRLPQHSERQKEIFDETTAPLKTALAVTGVNAMSAMCDVVGLTDTHFTENDDTVNNAFGYLHSAIYDLFGTIKRFVPEEEDADTVLDTFLSIYDGYFDKFAPQEA